MQIYLDSVAARDYIRSRGVIIGDNALKNQRLRETGPRCSVINGRVLYTREWIDEWIDAQASRPRVKRGRRTSTARQQPA